MGVRKLQSFIRRNVPNGTFPIDVKDEIRRYHSSTSKTPNPQPPVIVVDLMCLVYPFCRLDPAGVICGGRFNEISRCMNQFFGELKSLGAVLEFFVDGPICSVTPETWCYKAESYYRDMTKFFDAVDQGEDLSTMANMHNRPFHYVCTLKQAAMNHGRLHWATAKECDQEMVAFANKSKALAILSDDSDFLIYEGPWRLWSMKFSDIENLTATEYDRRGLMECLGLRASQMPLLATLAGNDIVHPLSLERFHRNLGRKYDIVPNVAKFICDQRNQTEDAILIRVLEFCSNRRERMSRFKESLNSFQVNYIPYNQKYLNESLEASLLSRNIALFYQMWHSKNIVCICGMIDMRQQELGEQIPQLKIALTLRMGGIILYQRQMQRRMVDYSECHMMIKLSHDSAPALHRYRVEFPTHIKPPPLEELLSNDPVTCSDLRGTKTQLLCWIVSASLDHRRLEAVPKSLQITVLTLYCLVERHMIEHFEADLLLQVAHDVTFSKYDPQAVSYPEKLASRPFRVAFAYQQIYATVANAFNLVGLNAAIDEDPPFDGVLFHNWYDDWSRQRVVSSKNEWRLYESIAAAKKDEVGV